MTMTPVARLVQLHKAVGHPIRLRLLAMLRGGPLCVCQMTAVVGLASSTVSEHIAELRKAALVLERKEGRWVEYRLSGSAPEERALEAIWPSLDGDRTVEADALVLRELRRVPLEELCRAGLDVSRLSRPRLAAVIGRAALLREPAR